MIDRALIVGGGLGGLATALALQQDGVETIVLERREELAEVAAGAGLMIWHNGMSVLDRLGVGAGVRGASTEIDSFAFSTWKGGPLMRWDVAALGRELGAPTIGINRGDLHEQLRAALAPGTLRLGAEAVGVTQDGDGVTVELRGGERLHGDLLIGADGINSRVRREVAGARAPRYAGYTTWRGLLEFPQGDAPVGHAHKMWGPGRRLLFYRVGDGQLYWLALVRAPAGGRDEPGHARDAVLAQFQGWHDPVAEMLAATPEDAIARLDIHDHNPFRRWGTGRITLLGDAAHAMTPNMGQGACQALEDAIVLTTMLREHDDVVAGLRAYERGRRKRTAYFQRHSRLTGRLGRWQLAPAVRAREAMIRVAFNGFATKQHVTEMRSAP
jgi:2-polyprenyl-6-methoxyphenol hydroxylase-like FAD-dependent oxidoreductase